MIPRVGSTKTTDIGAYKGTKGFYIGNLFIPLKEWVTWGAIIAPNRISTRLEGTALHLTGIDYKGVEITSPVRSFKLLNADITELIMPKTFISQSAVGWLERINGRLALKIANFKPGEHLPSNTFNLCAGIDPITQKACGILLLGAQ